ncbi:fatty acyl-AMP ligase [Nocardia sp. NPDC050408]|uniref:fatty acyl-AMP ligase n=1 Tax=unclassified Nocardia TaxID=2637762 RepID=UPI0034397C83
MSRFIDDVLASSASERGFSYGDPDALRRKTWAELLRHSRCAAQSLADQGVTMGSRVAILAGEPEDVVVAVLACWLLGASATMLHQPTHRTDLTVWARDTIRSLDVIDAKLVLIGPPFDSAATILAEHDVLSVSIARLDSSTPLEPTDVPDDTLALLQLTSGSTGSPKAVAITHANLYASGHAIARASDMDPARDVGVSWLPLFHDMGMVGFVATPLQFGVEVVCVSPTHFLRSPLVWMELITRHHGTMTAAPNFAYEIVARRMESAPDGAFDLSSMRFALNGAEPIDATAVAQFIRAGARFGLSAGAVVPAYGMAEATLAVSFSPIGKGVQTDAVRPDAIETTGCATPAEGADARLLVTLGAPVPGVEARVLDDTGVSAQPRTVGEILISGATVTDGYFTENGYSSARNEGGWLATGDLGYLTESGEIVVCGRKKDTIIVAGRNIFPTDIERAAATVAGVRRGNTVAVRLEPGEIRESFAVAVESADWNDDQHIVRIQREVTRAVRDSVGATPRSVAVVAPGSIPKTPSGKVRRTNSAHLVR